MTYVPHRTEAQTALFAPPTDARPTAGSQEGNAFWGKDGLTFGDLLDVVNPLQHLPVVGDIYRALTGDEISSGARLAGGTLFGGPVGLVGSVATLAVEQATGATPVGHVVAALSGTVSGAGAAGGAGAPTGAPVQVAALHSAEGADALLVADPLVPLAPAAPGGAPAGSRAPRPDTDGAPPPATVAQAAVAQAAVGNRDEALPQLSPAAFNSLISALGATPADGTAAHAVPASQAPPLPRAVTSVRETAGGPAIQAAKPSPGPGHGQVATETSAVRAASLELAQMIRKHHEMQSSQIRAVN